jgi:HAD superfamily hydrolase (TIGR01484 family)
MSIEQRMRPLKEFPPQLAANIGCVFSDIDDTITTDGLIPAPAYEAIWRAHRTGLKVVLVTGRPAGWCDHLARMWPVAGVVGENGALAFARRDGRVRRLYAERPVDAAERLEAIRQRVLAEVPRVSRGYRSALP